MAKARRQDEEVTGAKGPRLSIDRDDEFAFDGLDAHGSRGVVLWKCRAWIEGEERDGPSLELEERLLAMAVLGWAFGSQSRKLAGEIKDL